MITTKSTFAIKEMRLLRLAVTTACGQGCRYCFIRRRGEVLSYPSAAWAIDLLLRSPGENKILMLYGGEPLLAYDLLRKIVSLARAKARKFKKKLVVSVGTNGLLLDRSRLAFFRKNRVRLALSMDGPREVHDASRPGADGEGTYDKVLSKLPLVFGELGKRDVCCLCAVTPASAPKLSGNLEHLFGLGFENVNVEPVVSPSYRWDRRGLEAFGSELRKTAALVYRSVLCRQFLFLNSVSRVLAGQDGRSVCPFYNNFELYPPGRAGFSPLFLNKEGGKTVVWDRGGGWRRKYRDCACDPSSPACLSCWEDYSRGMPVLAGAARALEERSRVSRALAARIRSAAVRRPEFTAYAAEAAKRIFE